MRKKWLQFEEKILRIGIVVLLLAIPLYPKFPLFDVPGTYVAVRMEDFLIAFLGAVWAIRILRNPKEFLSDRINQAIILFLVVGILSVLSGIVLTQTVVPHLGFLHWARRVEYLIPFFIAVSVVKSKKDVRLFTEVLLVAAFFAFLYGLGQIYLRFPVISTQNVEFSKGLALYWVPGARLQSTFAGHYDLAAFTVMVLPIAFGLFFAAKRLFGKALVLIAVAGMFWLLLASASRISIPAYFVSTTLVLWLLKKRKWIIPVLTASVVLILMSGALTQRFEETWRIYITRYTGVKPISFRVEDYQKKFLQLREKIAYRLSESESEPMPTPRPTSTPAPSPSPEPSLAPSPSPSPSPTPSPTPTPMPTPSPTATPSPEPEATQTAYGAPVRKKRTPPSPTPPPVDEAVISSSIRTYIEWPRAIRAFTKNPLLGTGYSSITLATDNDYLRLLGEVGIVGTLAFFLVLTRIIMPVLKAARKASAKVNYQNALLIGFLGAFVAVLITTTFIDVFEASKAAIIFWLLAGISVGIVKNGLVRVKAK